MPDVAFATVGELSAAIGSRRLSPVDLVETLLGRIARLDDKLHAFVAVHGDDARLAAEGADRAIRAGHRIGPLHGIPVALKDLVELEGRVTTGGSAAWRDRVSPITATLARRLVGAGMIVLGKTHTVEFAMGGWGTNHHRGTPWNPWDLGVHRVPGGSSSGSGVAVAAGLVPAAIGTDTGGSVRLPAAFCGIVGLKVTAGRISTHGVLPLSPTLDTPGPMTRSVEDAALLYRVLAGPDEHDPATLALPPPPDPLPGLRAGVAGLRLATLPRPERDRVDGEVLAAYDAAVETLAGLGARPVDLALPHGFDGYAAGTGRIIAPEGYRAVARLIDDPAAPLDPHVRQRLQTGRAVTAREYLDALAEREERQRSFRAALGAARADAFLTPTTRTAAIPVAEVDEASTPAHFTRAVNYLGLSAVALPAGFTEAGLPLSLQVVCRGQDEALALRIAWAYEAATPWHTRRPAGLA